MSSRAWAASGGSFKRWLLPVAILGGIVAGGLTALAWAGIEGSSEEVAATGEPGQQEPNNDEAPTLFDPFDATAVAVVMSQQLFDDGEAENIVLARDTPSGDALAAGSLIGLFETTLLLTDSEVLTPETAAEIERLGEPNVHILGGHNAVSPEIEQQLQDAGHMVHRHAGPRQSDTAANVAELHFPDARTAVLIETPDRLQNPTEALTGALAASAFAAAQEAPILITDGDELSEATDRHLQSSSIQEVVVIGDEDTISPDVTSRLEEMDVSYSRWGQGDRFTTAVEIAQERGFTRLEDADVVLLVEGTRDTVWPGGFLGAVISARQNGPVLLTDGDELPRETAEYLATASTESVELLCTPGVADEACQAAVDVLAEG